MVKMKDVNNSDLKDTGISSLNDDSKSLNSTNRKKIYQRICNMLVSAGLKGAM